MNKSTPGQRMAIGIIITRLRLDKETKALMVKNYSNGRASSTLDLFYHEAALMIKNLNKSMNYKGSPSSQMKGKILSLFHEMRYELRGGKIDMDRVNGFCCKYGCLHKPLDSYTEEELPKLVTQVEQVYKDYLKGI